RRRHREGRAGREAEKGLVVLAVFVVVADVAEFQRLPVAPAHLALGEQGRGVLRGVQDLVAGAEGREDLLARKSRGISLGVEGRGAVLAGEVVALLAACEGGDKLVVILDEAGGEIAVPGVAVEAGRT